MACGFRGRIPFGNKPTVEFSEIVNQRFSIIFYIRYSSLNHRFLDIHRAPEAEPAAEARGKIVHAHILLLVHLDHVQLGFNEIIKEIGDVAATVKQGQYPAPA